jgi:hypothetical protein
VILLLVLDEEKEFLNLDDLKPHHLANLGSSSDHQNHLKKSDIHSQQHIYLSHNDLEQGYIYCDLNLQKSDQYFKNKSQDMTIGGNIIQSENSLNSMDASSQNQYSKNQNESRKRKFSYS